MTDQTNQYAFSIAKTLHTEAEDEVVESVMQTLDDIVIGHRARRGDVLIACAQTIAHCIADAPETIASDMQDGVSVLIHMYVETLRSKMNRLN